MKGSSSLLLGALCALGAIASPVDKRVLVTDVEVTVVTVTITETPGAVSTAPAVATTTTTAGINAGAAKLNNQYPHPSWTSTSTTTDVVVPSSTSLSSSVSSYSSSWSSSSSSTSTYVVPEPTTTSVVPEPTTSSVSTTSVPSTSSSISTTSTSSSASSSSTASSYETMILDSHNIHRSNHSAPALTWNATLAESALALANTCDYHHDTTLGPAASYGQNIGYGVDAAKVDEMITDMMYNDEMMYYQNLYGEADPDMTDFDNWGHFSQIVWVDTASVGCATVTCDPLAESGSSMSLPFTVCNYYPAGNYGGEYADNVLKPSGDAMVTAA